MESQWLALPPPGALRGLIQQILSYIHQFHTSTSSRGGLGLEAVLTRGQLYSSLPDELEVPGLPAKQESPKPGPLAQGLGVPGAWPSALCEDLETIAQMESWIKELWQVTRGLRWEGSSQDNLWKSLS